MAALALVARRPEGTTVEAALIGAVPEDQIECIGQTALAPVRTDDLVLVNLAPGTYTLRCLIDEHDGVPHVAKGLAAQLTIERTAPSTP